MDLVKVAGVMEWPALTSKKEVQLFLWFVNFYCQFIEGFSHHAHPLFDLTQNNITWKWGSHKKSTFDTLKWIITMAPVLVLSDDSRPFRIETDSSDFAT